MGSGEADRRGVGFDGDGTNRIKRGLQVGEGFDDHIPLEAKLAAKDGGELVQDLNADHAAGENRLCRATSLLAPLPWAYTRMFVSRNVLTGR